jgi:hypothetical protein
MNLQKQTATTPHYNFKLHAKRKRTGIDLITILEYEFTEINQSYLWYMDGCKYVHKKLVVKEINRNGVNKASRWWKNHNKCMLPLHR